MIPKALSKGDKIGVVSPSNPVSDCETQLLNGIKYVEDLGFEIVLGKHVRSTSLGYCASPEEKAEDINSMFRDPSISAIICSQGGETANASLPYLDWDLIKANPKIILGISDISVLLNAIYTMTGLVTYHGNDIMWGFGNNPTEYDKEEFLKFLVEGQYGFINPSGERRTIRGGVAEGKLIGGNLHCLLNLSGTKYFPDFTDKVYFVEAYEVTPEECDCMFRHLQQLGVFERLKGVVVGYIDSLQKDGTKGIQMEDVLLEVTKGYSFPILKANDFGHNCPNTTLPLGITARIDAEKQIFEILESCVQ